MKGFARSSLALGISLAVMAPANASDFADMDPVTLRLAHVVNEQDGFHIAAMKFEELVEERTGGKVSVDLYPNASLGDERTLLEGMQIGTVDMGVITNGPVPTSSRRWRSSSCPSSSKAPKPPTGCWMARSARSCSTGSRR